MTTDTQRFPKWTYPVLIVLGLAAFWPTVCFDFVNWDDPAYILNNELITSWSPGGLHGVATETVTRNYAPLTIFSFLIDHSLWGLNPSGYHATNVLLHISNGILVLILVKQLTGSAFVAGLTAALFLVHPIQIETVAWVSSRKGLLSATFMLAALTVRLRPDVEPKHDLWYVIWLCAALLSKALAVVVPAVVLAYDVWVRRDKFAEAFARQIIPGVMCLLLLLKTMASQNSILGGVRGHLDYSIWHILAIDTTIMWRYVCMLVWPTDLCVLYDPPTVGIWKTVLAASVGWAVVAAGIWKSRQRYPLILWGAVTWLLLLLPVLNFFRITTLMNDRYLYLPCIVAFACFSSGLNRLLSVGPLLPDVARFCCASTKWTIAAGAVCLAFILTSLHLPVWQNSESLWHHAMSQVPQVPVVRIQMACTLHDIGQRREAVRTMQRALFECQPDELDRKRMLNAIQSWSEELSSRTALGPSADNR